MSEVCPLPFQAIPYIKRAAGGALDFHKMPHQNNVVRFSEMGLLVWSIGHLDLKALGLFGSLST